MWPALSILPPLLQLQVGREVGSQLRAKVVEVLVGEVRRRRGVDAESFGESRFEGDLFYERGGDFFFFGRMNPIDSSGSGGDSRKC